MALRGHSLFHRLTSGSGRFSGRGVWSGYAGIGGDQEGALERRVDVIHLAYELGLTAWAVDD